MNQPDSQLESGGVDPRSTPPIPKIPDGIALFRRRRDTMIAGHIRQTNNYDKMLFVINRYWEPIQSAVRSTLSQLPNPPICMDWMTFEVAGTSFSINIFKESTETYEILVHAVLEAMDEHRSAEDFELGIGKVVERRTPDKSWTQAFEARIPLYIDDDICIDLTIALRDADGCEILYEEEIRTVVVGYRCPKTGEDKP